MTVGEIIAWVCTLALIGSAVFYATNAGGRFR